MVKLAETVTIVVHPSGTDADNLTVADAMQQVLDTFELLSKAEFKDGSSGATVVWRLERASTNSPLTVEAIPVSSNPEFSVDRQAINAILSFQKGMNSVLHAESKPLWIDQESEQTLKRILARNLNGIGRTDIFSDYFKSPTSIDHRSARRAQNYLDVLAAEEALKVDDLTHKEYGSIEGHVTDATTWHGRPAFRMRARLSGKELICILSKTAAAAIGDEHNWSEVFTRQRVLVSGICHYNSVGIVIRVDVDTITAIKPRDVPVSELRDTNFSSGRTPADHLLPHLGRQEWLT